MQAWDETLLSQYVDSPTIYALIESLNEAIDPAVDISNFYANVWDINTAVGYGLDVWGRIVGVGRNIQVPVAQTFFGFAEAYLSGSATNPQPFGSGVFYTGTPTTQSYSLPDSAYRQLVLAKAFANISNCTVPNINALLRFMFGISPGISWIIGTSPLPVTIGNGTNQVYVNDLENMTYQIVATQLLTPVDVSIINSGILPKPAGISYTLLQG